MRQHHRRTATPAHGYTGVELRRIGEDSKLNNQWNLYGGGIHLGGFSTIAGMWRLLNNIPTISPSERGLGLGIQKDGVTQCVVELSLFRDGSTPEWESYSKGGIIDTRLALSPPDINSLWLRLVLVIVGGQAPETASLAGIRLVNKSTHRRPASKLELWLHDDAPRPAHVEMWMKKEVASVASPRGRQALRYTPYEEKAGYRKKGALRQRKKKYC